MNRGRTPVHTGPTTTNHRKTNHMATLIKDKYEARKAEVNERFEQLRANEEELNRIFAKVYHNAAKEEA